MVKILFVCSGNTCRSPMAEYIMKDLVKKAGLGEELTVASVGCRATLGKDITGKAKAILEQYKIPFEEHKAAQFTAADYAMYDYIIGFDQNNVDDITEIAGGDADGKVQLLTKHARSPRVVNDPFATGDYDKTFADIRRECKAWLKFLCPEKAKNEPKNTSKMIPLLLDALAETDERHIKNTEQLREDVRKRWFALTGKDETLSVSTIGRQIDTWRKYGGYDIAVKKSGAQRGYYMAEFPIEAPEALLIAQSLFRAQNFTKDKTVKLLDKLRKFTDATGREHIDLMKYQLTKANTNMRRRTGRKEIFAYINVLMEAIRGQRQVSFFCYKWDLGDGIKKSESDFVVDENGKKKKFTVSPYYVVWEGDECWLICHCPENDPKEGHILSHFRISLMTGLIDRDEENTPIGIAISIGKMLEFERYVAISTQPGGKKWWMNTKENKKREQEGKKYIMHSDVALKEFVLDRYLRENLYMKHNDIPPVTVTLWFRESAIGEVRSRFAIDRRRIRPCQVAAAVFSDDEAVLSAEVVLQPNDGMYMWLMEHADEILVVKPDKVREEMKRRLEVALKGLRSYEDGAVEANNSAEASLFGMYEDQRKYLRVIEFD